MSGVDKKKKNIPNPNPNPTNKPPPPIPVHYESPKRPSVFKTLQFKSTAIQKSPFSKMIEELDHLPDPRFSKTPKKLVQEEMVQYKTPDNRQTLVVMKMAEKLDFDCLGGSARKHLDVIPGDESNEEGEEELEGQYSYYEEEEEEGEEIRQQETPAQNKINKFETFVFEQEHYANPVPVKAAQKAGKICCNCKKSRCLKLYCECFRNNQICSGCNCVQCLNTSEHCPERFNAYVNLVEANPLAFCPKIQSQKHTKGCNCKKSNCQKRYCQCYQAGLSCTDLCRCQQCKNRSPEGAPNRKHNHKVPIDKGLKQYSYKMIDNQ